VSAWVKVMVSLRSHPKVVQLSDGAFRLYIDSICWAGEHLTDGAIPEHMLAGLAPGLQTKPAKTAEELVAAGLWNRIENGWTVHDYLDVQTSAASVEKKRADAAKRMAEKRAIEPVQNGSAS
jgi:hypothetical protein